MTVPYATPPAGKQWLTPSVAQYFRGLSTLRRVSLAFAAVGMLLMYLAAVFNWYTVKTTSQYKTSKWSQEQPVSIGTLLLGDTEEQYTNPYAGSSSRIGKRPEFESYADIYSIFYLVFALGLVALVVAALMTQGKVQLYLRVVAGGCAALSLFFVILISADLSEMAIAYQKFMTEQGSVGSGEAISYTVEKSVGVGLVLGAVASLLLGVSAGLNHIAAPVVALPGSPVPPPPQQYAGFRPPMPGPPGPQPGQISAPPWASPASGPPASAPMAPPRAPMQPQPGPGYGPPPGPPPGPQPGPPPGQPYQRPPTPPPAGPPPGQPR